LDFVITSPGKWHQFLRIIFIGNRIPFVEEDKATNLKGILTPKVALGQVFSEYFGCDEPSCGKQKFGAVSAVRAFIAVSCKLVCPSAISTRLLVSPVPRNASRYHTLIENNQDVLSYEMECAACSIRHIMIISASSWRQYA
jgi:hypothetical protein